MKQEIGIYISGRRSAGQYLKRCDGNSFLIGSLPVLKTGLLPDSKPGSETQLPVFEAGPLPLLKTRYYTEIPVSKSGYDSPLPAGENDNPDEKVRKVENGFLRECIYLYPDLQSAVVGK
jgi:hypothetical protein